MIAKKISSVQHPLVKHLVRLRKEREYRRLHQSVALFGRIPIDEIAPHLPLNIVLAESQGPPPSHWRIEQLFYVPWDILKKVSGLKSPPPFIACVALPPPADLSACQRLLVCDAVGDPGNLGTLLRSALALGWDGAFLTNECVDPFNDKALRAARGASFRLPLCMGSKEELRRLLAHRAVYVADAHGEPLEKKAIAPPLALILGNEARGPSSLLKKQGSLIGIPMRGPMESLNVASAGAILLFALGPK